MAQGHYELKTAKDGQFMFNLIATNGQVILTSELYKTKASAQNGINWYFFLKSAFSNADFFVLTNHVQSVFLLKRDLNHVFCLYIEVVF